MHQIFKHEMWGYSDSIGSLWTTVCVWTETWSGLLQIETSWDPALMPRNSTQSFYLASHISRDSLSACKERSIYVYYSIGLNFNNILRKETLSPALCSGKYALGGGTKGPSNLSYFISSLYTLGWRW